MTARHDALLVAQDDVAAVRPSRNEERQEPALGAFDMGATAVPCFYRLLVERFCDHGKRAMKQASPRGGQSNIARRPVLVGAFKNLDPAQVGVA